MSLPTFENVLLERTGTDDRIGVLTLNRPEKMNALSQELIYDFRDACEHFEADDDVRVIIVKGAGRTFSAGYDLTPAGGYGADAVHRRFRTVDDDGNRLIMGIRGGMARVTDIWLYFWNMQKITIAQLHGYALAGGCELAM
ncbi:MAG: enoyl-CoA hydratase/isomerase family protein, partial [Chloroflexi bacterium]|nr:enoyl-CoA hydratase/isomerase family protein [Chloroflexota bacterium]